MGFLDEVAKLLEFDEQAKAVPFVYFCLDKGAVVEGYRKIVELSQTKIILLCQDSTITIEGRDLRIKEISYKEISILGKIQSISQGA